jgi:hypothetical protein
MSVVREVRLGISCDMAEAADMMRGILSLHIGRRIRLMSTGMNREDLLIKKRFLLYIASFNLCHQTCCS